MHKLVSEASIYLLDRCGAPVGRPVGPVGRSAGRSDARSVWRSKRSVATVWRSKKSVGRTVKNGRSRRDRRIGRSESVRVDVGTNF